jgi:hypothetical protein
MSLKKHYFAASTLLGISPLIVPIMVAKIIPQDTQQPAPR